MMKKIFDLETQNENLDSKITAGLERLSQVFKVLLWEKAKKQDLTPLQIQLLIFIRYHSKSKATISYLAKEFNITKATVSDTIKILEQKKYVAKKSHFTDLRSQIIVLTNKGLEIIYLIENFANPVYDIVASSAENEKVILWKSIRSIIEHLHHFQIINVQSACIDCFYLLDKNDKKYCSLMQLYLGESGMKIDCNEHKTKRLQ